MQFKNVIVSLIMFVSSTLIYGQSAEMLVQIGHTDKVMCVDYSSDGEYIVTGGMDHVVKLWEVKTGFLIRTFKGHKGMVYQVKISSDGNFIYSCSHDDKQFIKWDVKNGLILKKNTFKDIPIGDFCLTDDGSTIIAQGDEAIYLINSDLNIQKKIDVINPKSIVISPDNQKFYVLSDEYSDPKIFIYSLKNYSKLDFIKSPTSMDNMSMAGSQILLSGYKEVYTVNVDTRISKKIYERDSVNIYSSAIHASGKIYIGLAFGQILIVDEKDKIQKISAEHFAAVNALKFSKDGKFLVTASNDWSSQLIEASSGRHLKWFKSNCDYINHFQLSENGSKIAFVSGNTFTGNQIGIWNLQNARFSFQPNKRPPFDAFLKVAFNEKQSAIIAANGTGETFWYNFPKNANYWSFTSGNSKAQCVALTANGKNGIVGTKDGQLIFWRPERNKRENFEISSKHGISAIAISPDEKTIIAGLDNGQFNIIDFETKTILQKIESHSVQTGYKDTTWVMTYGTIVSMNIGINSNDEINSTSITGITILGDTVAVCGGNWINFFDVKTGQRIKQIVQNGAGFGCIDFSSDGKQIVASGADGIVRIYNCLTGNLEHALIGHQNEVREVSFSADPNFVISGSLDSQIKIWDLQKNKELLSAITALGGNEFIIYNPEGYYFTSKGAGNLVSYRIGQKVFPFDQFDLQYNRPDLIMKDLSRFTSAALDSPINSQLIKSYYNAYVKRLQRLNISENEFNMDFHVPTVQIEKGNKNISTIDSVLNLQIKSLDPKFELKSLHILVNGVPVFGSNGIPLTGKNVSKEIDLILNYANNKISVYCLNTQGVKSLVESFEIVYNPTNIISKKYYIGIGVNSYLDTNFNLKYSSKDVTDLANLYKETHPESSVITLINKQVTRENILKLKEVLTNTNVNDEVVILLSGHGLLSDELDFYYATYDVEFSNPKMNGILFSDLESILDGIPARKKLLLIDACHSGELDKTEVSVNQVGMQNVESKDFNAKGQKMMMGLGNSFELMKQLFADLQKGTGATIIASSSGKYFSFEYDELKNGVFTYSLKEAFSGKADKNGDGNISVSELNTFLTKRVSELTKGKQEPTSREINSESDFVVW